MNKLLTKIVGVVLGTTMAVGVGVGVAVNSERKDIDSQVNAAATTVSVNIGDYATANGWTGSGGGPYKSVSIDSHVTASLKTTGGNSGKYYSDWRLYQSESEEITISTDSGTLSSITYTYSVSNNGVLATVSGTSVASANRVTSGTAKSVSGSSYSLYVANTSTKTNGQVRITEISVTYTPAGAQKLATPSPVFNDNNKQVTWNAISGASSYQVKVDSGDYATATSPFDVSGLTTGSQHTVYVIAKGDGTNYTDSDAGSVSFTPSAPKVLSSISVSGQTTTFEQGDTFAFGGTVTAHYTDSTSSDVTTEATFSGYNMSTAGEQTVTVSYTLSGTTKTTTYGITVNAGPDVVLNATNKPYTSTSNSNTDTEEVTLDGIQYNSFAAYIYNSYLSFNRSQSGAYLYNDTAFAKNIKKIVVDFNSGGSGKFTMYEGTSAGTEGLEISPSSVGTGKITYTFSDTNQFFKYKLTTTGTYCNINSISIYLGSTHKTLSSIAVKTAPTKTAYKANEEFNAAGLVITATYSDASTADIAYNDVPTAFSFSPATITAAGNVTITYGEKTCTQAVTLITVTNVTGVASAPTEVYKDASINASSVTLNVTYSDSSVGTVTADSVTCDTSSLGTAEATATYNAATGTKTAKFNIKVVKEPVYDYIVDELVVGDTGISGTTYGEWSGVTKTSGAVYAGNTNENNNGGIGMRQDTSKVPSGIIVTSTPGVATKVEVSWTTTTSRTIHIKGQDTAYSSIEFASDVTGTEVGTITYNSTSVDLSAEYKYICIYVTGGAAGLSSIKITWKIEGAADPLTANPVLSTGSEADVHVGKNIALGITTTPVDSDEKLIVTSSDESYVTVSGSGRNYVIHGVAIGSATVTVSGAKGVYSSSVLVTVSAATKTYEDKIMTPDDLGLGSYETSDTTHTYDGVDFITKEIMKSGGFQFKKNEGYLYNNETLYASNNIKTITLIMRSTNGNEPKVYEASEAGAQTTLLSSKDAFVANGVNTYVFSGSSQFFRIDANADGVVNIDKIIIEMEDSSSTILSHARSAAAAILSGLSGLCGDNGSGNVTQSQWDSINSALAALNLTDDDKLFLKNADRIMLGNLSQGGAEIENAMAHYDACVQKFGYTDVLGIANVASANPSLNNGIINNTAITSVVVIISIISLSTLCGYFLLRKRKEQ